MDSGFSQKLIIGIIWLMWYLNVDKRIIDENHWQMFFSYQIKILQS